DQEARQRRPHDAVPRTDHRRVMRMRLMVGVALGLCVLLLGAAPGEPPDHPVNFIHVDQLKALLDAGTKADIIDVRREQAYVRTQKGIRECEVFVAANGSLLARLNYTSHIPCNGVEEPKSTESCGIGLQVVFESGDGATIGFGSEPSDLTLEGVKRALDKAR